MTNLSQLKADLSAWLQQSCCLSDVTALAAARQRQDNLTKPRGSLGRLEELAVQLAGLQDTTKPTVDPVYILQIVSDHGVAIEGVSAFPQTVTMQMLYNIANGGAAISVLARELNAQLEILDLGTIQDPGSISGVRSERLGAGTGNIARESAMTELQMIQALFIGRSAVIRAKAAGARLFIGGEMGIANTTPATALACALLNLPAADIAGPGTGLTETGLAHKIEVIKRALNLHAIPGSTPLELLTRLGGFDLAALTGAFLTAAQLGLPILVDGFIVTVAALLSVRLQPWVREWMLFAHRSAEPGHQRLLTALSAVPLLDLGLRLGEASAAAVAVPILRCACVLHNQMATFDEAKIAKKI